MATQASWQRASFRLAWRPVSFSFLINGAVFWCARRATWRAHLHYTSLSVRGAVPQHQV